MKKVLFATTALIATAGMAAAELNISGYGRFGLTYDSGGPNAALEGTGGYPSNGNDRAVNGVSKTNIISRLRLQFDYSTETDSGVEIGGRMRAEADNDNNAPQVMLWSAPRFYVSYGGFTVGVGNINGAFEYMPGTYLETRAAGAGLDGAQFVSHIGNVNDEYFNWDYYDSDGNVTNGVEAMYSAGGFGAHLSYSTNVGAVAMDRIAANVSYTFGDWTVALAHQSSDNAWEDKTAVSLSGDLGQFGVRVAYADNEGIGKLGLYGNVELGAASKLVAWVTDEDAVSAADVAAGRNDNRDSIATSNGQEGTSFGINYSYDLGGGASFETGYRRGSNDNNTFQAGVAFSF